MILDFFPENALGDGPKKTRIRVKGIYTIWHVYHILYMIYMIPYGTISNRIFRLKDYWTVQWNEPSQKRKVHKCGRSCSNKTVKKGRNWTICESERSRNLKLDDSMAQTVGSNLTVLRHQNRRSQGMKGPSSFAFQDRRFETWDRKHSQTWWQKTQRINVRKFSSLDCQQFYWCQQF